MSKWVENLNTSIRPLCALIVVSAMSAAFIRQTFAWQLDVKDAFIGLTGIVVGWFFGKRDAQNDAVQAAQPAQTPQERG